METKFVLDGASVIEVIEIGEYLVPAANMILKTADHQTFESREDARYHCMLEGLKKGKDITTFKSSKYYKYYIERLKKENPEYII